MSRGEDGAAARVRLAERVLPPLLRLWGATWRYAVTGIDHLREARDGSSDGRVVFCCWHGRLLPLLYLVRGRGMRIVVSRHRDGEIVARVAARLGFAALRGSTSRGGERALRAALRATGGADIALTPDGPRGPRGSFQPGAVFLASRSGLPVVPVGCAAAPAWRAASWDAFVVPGPFARVAVVCGAPLFVPPGADGAALEEWRAAAERSLVDASAQAEAGLAPAVSRRRRAAAERAVAAPPGR